MARIIPFILLILMTVATSCSNRSRIPATDQTASEHEALVKESQNLQTTTLDSLESFAAKIYVMKSENRDIPHVIEENIEEARVFFYSQVSLDSICEDPDPCGHDHTASF